jgi:hypothetical protein
LLLRFCLRPGTNHPRQVQRFVYLYMPYLHAPLFFFLASHAILPNHIVLIETTRAVLTDITEQLSNKSLPRRQTNIQPDEQQTPSSSKKINIFPLSQSRNTRT